jgi:tRNA A-37 threonylcarbamoyl transferase component Bud32
MKINYNELAENLEYFIVDKYYSKKNSVYLLDYYGNKIIAKVFNTPKYIFEFNVLNFLYDRGIAVPKPYSLVNNTILMEYVHGDTLMNIINSEVSNKERPIISLSDFFLKIHNIKNNNMSLLKGDFSIRNFIYDKKIVGLDFEESIYGNPLKDIGGTIAQIIDSSPSFTEDKFYLSKCFIERYYDTSGLNQDKSELAEFIIEGLLFDALFRPNQKEEIFQWASKIKKHFFQIFDISKI